MVGSVLQTLLWTSWQHWRCLSMFQANPFTCVGTTLFTNFKERYLWRQLYYLPPSSASGTDSESWQGSASLRKPLGQVKKEAYFLLSWSSCWFSLGAKPDVSARFGSYSLLTRVFRCPSLKSADVSMFLHFCISGQAHLFACVVRVRVLLLK